MLLGNAECVFAVVGEEHTIAGLALFHAADDLVAVATKDIDLGTGTVGTEPATISSDFLVVAVGVGLAVGRHAQVHFDLGQLRRWTVVPYRLCRIRVRFDVERTPADLWTATVDGDVPGGLVVVSDLDREVSL